MSYEDRYRGEPVQPFTKFEKTTSERYTFHAPFGMWCVITVSADIGMLQIASDFGDWSYRWGAPGKDFKRFLIGLTDADYFIGKMTTGEREVDVERTHKALHELVRERRKEGKFDAEEADGLDEEVERISGNSLDAVCAEIYHHDTIMEKLFDNDAYDVGSVVCTRLPIMCTRFFYEMYRAWFVPTLEKELGLAAPAAEVAT